jgi:hypothetical protein
VAIACPGSRRFVGKAVREIRKIKLLKTDFEVGKAITKAMVYDESQREKQQKYGGTTKIQPHRYHEVAPVSYYTHTSKAPETIVDPNKAFDPMVRYFCHPEDAQDKMSLSDFYPNFDERRHADAVYLVHFLGVTEDQPASYSSYRRQQPDISSLTNPQMFGLNSLDLSLI